MSTTQDGSPYDNAVAERINGIFKDEFGLGEMHENIHDVRRSMKKAHHLYNHKRPHLSCHYLTPEQIHQQQTLTVKTYRGKNAQKMSTQKPGSQSIQL